MKRPLRYWIKERDNPQLGTYYVPMGQMTCASAKAHESTSYGSNFMHMFNSEADYLEEIERLKVKGCKVH